MKRSVDVETYYVLKWKAAARHPVHPEPMIGKHSFDTVSEAVSFFNKQADDAVFISLNKVYIQTEDFSDVFILAKGM